MIAESLIVINMLAAGALLNRNTRDTYNIQPPRQEVPTSLISFGMPPTTLLGQTYSPVAIGSPIVYSDSDILVARALSASGIRIEDGFSFLAKAKQLLSDAQYPCVEVIPVLAHDMDEDAIYLTLKMVVNTTFETALELDASLTRGLVKSSKRIPERLSFAVYEAV